MSFIEELDLIYQTKIFPLLEAGLNPNIKYKQSISNRLLELEQAISVYLLQKIMHAIQHIAYSEDDFEYLYIHSVVMGSNLLMAYEMFQNQPALIFNNQAKEFKYRLIAWLKIIQKRKSEIFRALNEDDFAHSHKNAMLMIDDTREILNDAMKKVRQISKDIKAKETELKNAENANFFKRLFVKKENIAAVLQQLNDDAFEVKRLAFLNIIKQAKKYNKNTIYLEYENVIGITDTHRHYAVNIGENGFTRLPILIQLPEDKNFFNAGDTYQALVSQVAALSQKWTIEQYELMKEQSNPK